MQPQVAHCARAITEERKQQQLSSVCFERNRLPKYVFGFKFRRYRIHFEFYQRPLSGRVMHSLYVDEEGISFAIRPHSCLKLPIIRWSNAASPLMTTVQQSALVSDFNCWFVLSTQPLADRHIAWTQSRRYGIMGRLSAAVHRSPLSALP